MRTKEERRNFWPTTQFSIPEFSLVVVKKSNFPPKRNFLFGTHKEGWHAESWEGSIFIWITENVTHTRTAPVSLSAQRNCERSQKSPVFTVVPKQLPKIFLLSIPTKTFSLLFFHSNSNNSAKRLLFWMRCENRNCGVKLKTRNGNFLEFLAL